MLLTADPMFSRPRLDRNYTQWREQSGKMTDGNILSGKLQFFMSALILMHF